MTDHFPKFADLVAASFQEIAAAPGVFVTGADPDELYAAYLAAFPAGADPLFKERTEHDCSCCKQFIRRAGAVVAAGPTGEVRTIWDRAAESAPHPYNVVAQKLQDAVLARGISDVFRVGERESSFGAAQTRTLNPAGVVTWHHFHTGPIPAKLRVKSPGEIRGDYRTTVQVFTRGLTELTPDAVETVLALVEANSLYRGEEHRRSLQEFQSAQRAYLEKPEAQRHAFAWANASGSAARFRNTVIGTLVQDVSEGREVEQAVGSFEAKVAPQNYKRTSAPITAGMVKKAMEAIQALDLEPALERRFAVIGDVSVNDVKWVDGAAKPLMKGGIGAALLEHAATAHKTAKDEGRAEPIGLDDFVARVLPEATGVEVLLKGEHLGNLVSLTAPVHPAPKRLFRWSNDFAWSYVGSVADSIKERVKKAGGQVEGCAQRVSLSWFNHDDLDLHVYEPAGRGAQGAYDHIFYGNKRGGTGGVLDVDMNAGYGATREPVENVVWTKVPDGAYRVVVNNYFKRETSNVGFVVELEHNKQLSHFSYNKTVRDKQDVHVCTLHVKNGAVALVEAGDPAIAAANISQERWGLKTEQYAKVSAVIYSPNFWGDNAVGNRHTFFVLEGARNDEPTRGFYNEFLHPRLEPHRKVFEVIADKTKCQPADGQLSGLGFSSTKPAEFLARVQQNRRQRVFAVKVGA